LAKITRSKHLLIRRTYNLLQRLWMKKMREVQQGLSDPQSTTRIAMLAAMNIADEYFAMRNDKEKFSSDIEGKVQSIIELVDEELN